MTTHERIASLVRSADVVLFMKGDRGSPRCGFSATVVDILDDFLDEYVTVDVLSDPEIRDGVKAFSEWPTIPQLYVKGKFVGGSDIVKDLRASGELEALLGGTARTVPDPEVTISDSAIDALLAHAEGEERPTVRLEIDRDFRNALAFDDRRDGDVAFELPRIVLVLDRASAKRADGVAIDFVQGPPAGFKIDNPNAPPSVRELSPQAFRQMRDAGKPFELFDARTEAERAIARIEPSVLLDPAGRERLEALDRGTPLVIYCHSGMRSRAAGEHCIRMGFREVYNLAGGIDAWSRDVDPEVPRY